jgi:hypothetical protein
MNLKNVLRTYSLLRLLTNDESALLETLRSLSESEREQLVESLSPGKAVGKKRKVKSGGKSSRAASLAEQIKSSKRQGPERRSCTYVHPDGGGICSWDEQALIHDAKGGYQGYHEFQPPQVAAATGGD